MRTNKGGERYGGGGAGRGNGKGEVGDGGCEPYYERKGRE